MKPKSLNVIIVFILPIRHPAKNDLGGVERQGSLGEDVLSGFVVIDDPEVPKTKPMSPFFDESPERLGPNTFDWRQIGIDVTNCPVVMRCL